MKRWMLGVLGVSFLLGCAHETPPKDLVSSGLVKVQPVASNQADLPAPRVLMSGDVMEISGVVKRKADYNGPLDGHVKIEILSPTGQVLEQFPIEWQPQDVPVTGNREAEYALSYGWVPPQGTTVRRVGGGRCRFGRHHQWWRRLEGPENGRKSAGRADQGPYPFTDGSGEKRLRAGHARHATSTQLKPQHPGCLARPWPSVIRVPCRRAPGAGREIARRNFCIGLGLTLTPASIHFSIPHGPLLALPVRFFLASGT